MAKWSFAYRRAGCVGDDVLVMSSREFSRFECCITIQPVKPMMYAYEGHGAFL